MDKTTNIFILGSVCSGLGKGNFAGSLGRILKNLGFNVVIRKIDGYLNIDAGTINPIEHGEVFVTQDGQEGDLDLGTYERFMDYDGFSHHITTMGKIIFNTLMDERNGKQLGKTIENYHIENLLLNYIYQNDNPKIINIIEIGGVIGHDNQDIILKTISKIENKIVVVLSYGLWLNNLQEYKSLPIIFGLDKLKQYGIKWDFLCIRTEKPVNEYWYNYFIKKIGNYYKFQNNQILFIPDLPSSYGIYSYILNHYLPTIKNIIHYIENLFNNILPYNWDQVNQDKSIMDQVALFESYKNQPQKVKILILGKYNDLYDSYNSIYHSLYHSAAHLSIPLEIISLHVKDVPLESLKNYSGVIIPGGFGYSYSGQLLNAIKFIRENNIPCLGICLGLQLMVIEGLTNLQNLKVTSQEFFEENNELDGYQWAVHKIQDDRKYISNEIIGSKGGNMRLGNYDCSIMEDSLAFQWYKKPLIVERHRHRYEINNKFIEDLKAIGYKISGINPQNNLVEIVEYNKNNFFIGCQFHPELKSKIKDPHPLFMGFIMASSNGFIN